METRKLSMYYQQIMVFAEDIYFRSIENAAWNIHLVGRSLVHFGIIEQKVGLIRSNQVYNHSRCLLSIIRLSLDSCMLCYLLFIKISCIWLSLYVIICIWFRISTYIIIFVPLTFHHGNAFGNEYCTILLYS